MCLVWFTALASVVLNLPLTNLNIYRLSSSYVLGMLPVLKQQMDGAMAHAPSSHHARVRPAMMKMRLELQGKRNCTILHYPFANCSHTTLISFTTNK